ncbi:hypothetical protein Ae201684P_021629 [Aphanomyces euteiches]|nr:hypothetical protein Ae201684P_021629 [Aphanomyces euteiches]
MICDALWDIEADLDFLLPSNGKSNNVVVVGAAEESYTEEAQQTKRKRKKTRAPGTRKPYESRQRQEIFDLQHQVWMLENQLTQTASNSMLQTNMSQWERIARQQQGQMRTAAIENQNLQRAVDLNRSFISKMKAHSTKNPSLEPSLVSDWSVYKLGTQITCNYVYTLLQTVNLSAVTWNLSMPVLLMRRGMYGEVPSHGPITSTVTAHAIVQAPCRIVSQALWQVYNGNQVNFSSEGSQVVYERVGSNTVYERYSRTFCGIAAHPHGDLCLPR